MQTAEELEKQQAANRILESEYARIGIEIADRIREALDEGLFISPEGMSTPLATKVAEEKSKRWQHTATLSTRRRNAQAGNVAGDA